LTSSITPRKASTSSPFTVPIFLASSADMFISFYRLISYSFIFDRY
jgi:hypothetical protein